jgi:hypothetical protein
MRIETKGRRLRFETLEHRQMMAVFTVTNLNDAVVTAGGQAPGTLRQAIFDANATPAVADEIVFSPGLSGTISLAHVGSQVEGSSALVVSSPITIRGNASGITIARGAAATEMRLFRVTAAGNLTLESLNLAGGVARGAVGVSGEDGGDGRGGAVLNAGTLRVISSVLYDNVAVGGVPGGGDVAGRGLGGAIYNAAGTLIVRNATLSGNGALNSSEDTTSSAFGGGIYCLNGSVEIYNSTITDSSALTGRGIYLVAVGEGEVATAVIHSTIIGQSDAPVYDLFASFDSGGTVDVTGADNLIRWQNDFLDITVSNAEPGLNVLANYGGPTLTHALQAESAAIDLGSNVLDLATDQRGPSYARDVGLGVDIGAFESSSAAPALPGDYNRDHFVNAADYVLWRKFLGNGVATYAWADGNGSGQVDPEDYGVWNGNFGEAAAVSSPSFDSTIDAPVFESAGPSTEHAGRRRERAALPVERRSQESVRDKGLMAMLIAWDGRVRGERERLDFE